jgi:hypothetical protein
MLPQKDDQELEELERLSNAILDETGDYSPEIVHVIRQDKRRFLTLCRKWIPRLIEGRRWAMERDTDG